MASIEQLKQQIDCHDLADRLGLVRPAAGGNYRSPRHDDKSPSLQVFNDGKGFKDYSCEGDDHAQGSCIDLVIHCGQAEDVAGAIKWLRDAYGIPPDPPPEQKPRGKQSRAEFIASQCFKDTTPAAEYLAGRGIDEKVIERAITKHAVGCNDYTSPSKAPGEFGHGGPAAAFIVRSINPGHVAAVDLRYFDPDLNGGVKTQCQGERYGVPWFVDARDIKLAETVYLVESPINALSIETLGLRKTAAVAIRGTGNAERIDFRFLQGKRVVLCMDADQPDDYGTVPGQQAAWTLYERLTSMNIACHLVDQAPWYEREINDVNDLIQATDAIEAATLVQQLQPWAIAGMPAGKDNPVPGRSRVFLPAHDYQQYWKYRCKEDFMTFIKEVKPDEDGGEQFKYDDLAAFRVASIARVTIASANAAIQGGEDHAPQVQFAVTAQMARHGPNLVRRVFEDDKLHNIDQWARFGTVFNRQAFMRLISILERTTHLGARKATNLVGIGWQDGEAVVNEGPDCYFTDPKAQCPYHNLLFPSGPRSDARKVIEAYHKTMGHNAATLLLTWALGGHLKAWLGFWPHLVLQAEKGSGKTTLLQKLTNSLAFNLKSGQSLNTEWRLLTSVSHTTHPIAWEEISARRKDVIDKAVSLLQEAYNATVTQRGASMLEYLVCAPVLLAGEDVPVDSLIGKTVRSDISGKKGDLLPSSLPRFPVLEWLQFLTELTRERVETLYDHALQYAQQHCSADTSDDGADRIVRNYAGLMTCWRLLEEFADIPRDQLGFIPDCLAEMNVHVSETKADRQPWVWILQMIFGEISNGNYRFPYKFMLYREPDRDAPCLLLRCSHIVQHMSTTLALRSTYDSLPVKSDRILKKLLVRAGVVLADRMNTHINQRRENHMLALDLEALRQYNLHVSEPDSDQLEFLDSSDTDES